MPTLSYNDIKKFNITEYPIFIETGTLNGETIIPMSNFFEELYTIERVPELYSIFKKNNTKDNITPLLGDSYNIMPLLCKKINKNAVFFLDGHYSGGGTGKGIYEVPLYSELKSIMEEFKHKALIIVDDCRLFGTADGTVDWNDINESSILHIVKDRLVEHSYISSICSENDRLILKLKEYNT